MGRIFILIFIALTLPCFAAPGLDVRPQFSQVPTEALQTLDLILMQANDLTCEFNDDGLGRCGGSFGCEQFKDPVSCLDAPVNLSCNWSCSPQ